MKSLRFPSLTAPPTPLTAFDPGAYLGGLEFYETDAPVSDRIVVLNEGRLTAEFTRAEATEHKIMEAATAGENA